MSAWKTNLLPRLSTAHKNERASEREALLSKIHHSRIRQLCALAGYHTHTHRHTPSPQWNYDRKAKLCASLNFSFYSSFFLGCECFFLGKPLSPRARVAELFRWGSRGGESRSFIEQCRPVAFGSAGISSIRRFLWREREISWSARACAKFKARVTRQNDIFCAQTFAMVSASDVIYKEMRAHWCSLSRELGSVIKMLFSWLASQ